MTRTRGLGGWGVKAEWKAEWKADWKADWKAEWKAGWKADWEASHAVAMCYNTGVFEQVCWIGKYETME